MPRIADGDFKSIFGGLDWKHVSFLPKFGLEQAKMRTSAHPPRSLPVVPAALAAPGSLLAARNWTLGFPWHRDPSICNLHR